MSLEVVLVTIRDSNYNCYDQYDGLAVASP